MLLVQGGMSEESRLKLSLQDLVAPPAHPYHVPISKDGLIYDYEQAVQPYNFWSLINISVRHMQATWGQKET